MFTPLRPLWTAVFCLLALTSLTPASHAQNVWTWHNDNNRTGWQSTETTLTPSNVNTSFGLLWQWPVTGYVFAQPLAITGVQTQFTGCKPCDLVFVATEQDMLYAFKTTSNSQTPIWSLDLAGYVGGSSVTCSTLPSSVPFDPCSSGLIGPNVGVTGTPVIDTSSNPYTLYVAAAVYHSSSASIAFYLFAVDITTSLVRGTPVVISGSVSGQSPGGGPGKCTSDYPTSGTVTFDYNHIQRSALLLLPNSNVYVAFAPGGGNEIRNGWMFGYSFNGSAFTQTGQFNSTPYGTGGGIWGSGAGPAYDGTYIYAATANGTFDHVTQPIPYDIGDSLVKLDPSNLNVLDFYTPSDVLSYNNNQGLCPADEDFGSGGVLVVPPPYTYSCTGGSCPCISPACSVVINADKQSQLYVANRGNLGKFNASGGNNIENVVTPCFGLNCSQNPSDQGYWSSPAYWYDGTYYWLYYSPTVDSTDTTAAPYSIYAYQLATSGSNGPISQTATAKSAYPDLFCPYAHSPSVSSNPNSPATTGIVWTIEHQNSRNNVTTSECNGNDFLQYHHAALHALNAESMAQLYDSATTSANQYISHTTSFSTPTVFSGQVYMGTQQEVDVFGLCQNGVGGNCK